MNLKSYQAPYEAGLKASKPIIFWLLFSSDFYGAFLCSEILLHTAFESFQKLSLEKGLLCFLPYGMKPAVTIRNFLFLSENTEKKIKKEIIKMDDNRIRDIKGYKNFIKECDFFKCEQEYPGWTGTEEYCIVTDLSKETLEKKYPQIVSALSPYLIMNRKCGKVRRKSNVNNYKYDKRMKRTYSIYDMDASAEQMHSELTVPDFTDRMIEKKDNHEKETRDTICSDLCSVLNKKQKRRLNKKYLKHKTIKQIAKEENVVASSIQESIARSKARIKKQAEKCYKNGVVLQTDSSGFAFLLRDIISYNKNA